MIPLHVFFLFTDIYFYEIEIGAIIFDVILLWMNFYNYMTLNKIVCGIEAVTYAFVFVIALTHMKRVLFEIDTWTPMWMYFLQYFGGYLGGGAHVGFRLYTHFMQQHDLKQEKYSKTFVGRMYKKSQKKGEEML